MTSRKRKKQRVEERRLERARQLVSVDPSDKSVSVPPGAVVADHLQLSHNNTYSPLPLFYVDKVVKCRYCGIEEVWPAKRQKWWYEVAKGNINTQAVLCRACRQAEKEKKADARRVHLEGLALKNERNET